MKISTCDEKCYVALTKDTWKSYIIIGTRDSGRSYSLKMEVGSVLRRTRSHLKPMSFDMPLRANSYLQQNSFQDHLKLLKLSPFMITTYEAKGGSNRRSNYYK